MIKFFYLPFLFEDYRQKITVHVNIIEASTHVTMKCILAINSEDQSSRLSASKIAHSL